MSLYTKLFGLCLLAFTFATAGCDTGGNTEPTAPAKDELAQFIEDNPELANADEPLEEEE